MSELQSNYKHATRRINECCDALHEDISATVKKSLLNEMRTIIDTLEADLE